MLSLLEEMKKSLRHPPNFRLLFYLIVTLYLVLCGVTCFRDLPMGNLSGELNEQLRDTYEGYTVYLRRAALLIGVALGIYTATLGRTRGLPFGLAMLLTVHWGNAILFMIMLPPVRAGSLDFTAAHYYHAGSVIPAILVWLSFALSDWLNRRVLENLVS